MAVRFDVDAHFVPGHRHPVAQDYAVAVRAGDRGFGILADGCSSSPATDVGARVLVHATEVGLRRDPFSLSRALTRARLVCRTLRLPPEALDATLGLVRIGRETIETSLYGDGFFAITDAAGNNHLLEVDFEGNAPRYPAYALDRERGQAHAHRFGGRPRWRALEGEPAEPVWRDGGLHWTLPTDAVRRVMLTSDGLGAFADDHGELISPVRVLQQLTERTGGAGCFMRRRLHRFHHREAPALGWTGHDDLSAVLARVRA